MLETLGRRESTSFVQQQRRRARLTHPRLPFTVEKTTDENSLTRVPTIVRPSTIVSPPRDPTGKR